MKRAIVVSVRESKDKKTNNDVLFVTLYQLPSKTSKGGLWYPKNGEAVVLACFDKSRHSEMYEKFKTLSPCSICDITYGVNDFNGKTFVARLDVVEESFVSHEILYV